jgi:hypothetical protein
MHSNSGLRELFAKLVAELAEPNSDIDRPMPGKVTSIDGEPCHVSTTGEVAEQLAARTMGDWLADVSTRLHNCTDTLPRAIADDVETVLGSAHPVIANHWKRGSRTYASAARALKRIILQKKAA